MHLNFTFINQKLCFLVLTLKSDICHKVYLTFCVNEEFVICTAIRRDTSQTNEVSLSSGLPGDHLLQCSWFSIFNIYFFYHLMQFLRIKGIVFWYIFFLTFKAVHTTVIIGGFQLHIRAAKQCLRTSLSIVYCTDHTK